VNSRLLLYFILAACLVSSAVAFPMQNALDNNKATIWFQKEYTTTSNQTLTTALLHHLWSERKSLGPEDRRTPE